MVLVHRFPTFFEAGTAFIKTSYVHTPSFLKTRGNHKNSPIFQYFHFFNCCS